MLIRHNKMSVNIQKKLNNTFVFRRLELEQKQIQRCLSLTKTREKKPIEFITYFSMYASGYCKYVVFNITFFQYM